MQPAQVVQPPAMAQLAGGRMVPIQMPAGMAMQMPVMQAQPMQQQGPPRPGQPLVAQAAFRAAA